MIALLLFLLASGYVTNCFAGDDTQALRKIREELDKLKRDVRNLKQNKVVVGHFTHPHVSGGQHESGAVIAFNESISRDVVYKWEMADWVQKDVFNKHLHLDEQKGTVTVKTEGLYLVYAQLVYHDLSGRWAFGIFVGTTERIKCLATEQLRDMSNYDHRSHGVYHQCNTATTMYLRRYETLSIQCLYGMRTILSNPMFSFWGIIKL